MKTIKAILIMTLLSGQLSFGKGNDNCCPGSTSVTASQLMDSLQAESNEMMASVPSLQPIVTMKFREHTILDSIQGESETWGMLHLPSLARQVDLKFGIDKSESQPGTMSLDF